MIAVELPPRWRWGLPRRAVGQGRAGPCIDDVVLAPLRKFCGVYAAGRTRSSGQRHMRIPVCRIDTCSDRYASAWHPRADRCCQLRRYRKGSPSVLGLCLLTNGLDRSLTRDRGLVGCARKPMHSNLESARTVPTHKESVLFASRTRVRGLGREGDLLSDMICANGGLERPVTRCLPCGSHVFF